MYIREEEFVDAEQFLRTSLTGNLDFSPIAFHAGFWVGPGDADAPVDIKVLLHLSIKDKRQFNGKIFIQLNKKTNSQAHIPDSKKN